MYKMKLWLLYIDMFVLKCFFWHFHKSISENPYHGIIAMMNIDGIIPFSPGWLKV